MTDVLDDETRTLSEELQEEVRTELDVFSPLNKKKRNKDLLGEGLLI